MVTTDSRVTVTCETVQQSGISDQNPVSGLLTYYGKIIEILELDYGRLKPIVLLCNWVEPITRGPTACVKEDSYGYTFVRFSRLMKRSSNSFVFPLQVSQIFFGDDHHEDGWSIVLHADSRSTRVFQELPRNNSLSSFDVDGNSLPDDISEEEDVVMDVQFDDGQMDGYLIT